MYSCVEDKLFHAQRGRGAFLNGQPLQTSGQEGDVILHVRPSVLLVWMMVVFKVGFGLLFLIQSDINRCVVVTEIGAERDDLALSTMTSNIFRLLKLPVHG